jgi:hypothetical protein
MRYRFNIFVETARNPVVPPKERPLLIRSKCRGTQRAATLAVGEGDGDTVETTAIALDGEHLFKRKRTAEGGGRTAPIPRVKFRLDAPAEGDALGT